MSKGPENRSRSMTVISYTCRACTHLEVRHYFSAQMFEQDIIGQNQLCMRCYLDGNYEPGSLVPRERLPVIPSPAGRPTPRHETGE